MTFDLRLQESGPFHYNAKPSYAPAPGRESVNVALRALGAVIQSTQQPPHGACCSCGASIDCGDDVPMAMVDEGRMQPRSPNKKRR